MQTAEFSKLLLACNEIAALFPDGVVFIGGIAVYLHTQNAAPVADLAEFTHDADFYISLADMADLRDMEEVTANRRLSRHQIIKDGFEFDIYTERHSRLIVPFDEVMAASIVVGEMRLACPEHLMALKLRAFADRRASAKGGKDAADLLRIAAVVACSGTSWRPGLAQPWLGEQDVAAMDEVARGPFAMGLARGNAMRAKQLRQYLAAVVAAHR
ncbi:MAG: hypothetical protein FJ100_05565 [Deltaproteobacteria bacterium]|nr:hypothetical protein [Deltaproteobacteria bacterium]